MQISRADELDLLTVLHEGMHEQPAWNTFLSRLLRRVSAQMVRLLLVREGTGVEFTARPRTRLITASRRSISEPDDPTPYANLRPQRVYAFSELPGASATSGRIVRTGFGDFDAWLSIIGEADDDFSPRDGALLSALTPHLAIALRNYAAVEHDLLQRHVGGWALARLGRGWIALSARGRVIAADRKGEQMLEAADQIRQSPDRRLLAASPAANQRLTAALGAVIAQPGAAPRAVRISEEPRLELLLAPIETEELDAPIIGAAVAAHIQTQPPDSADAAVAIGELFDLSPAVARFAWALGRAGGIPEAAEQLGISVETARSYSKALYAKLGVKGQADLTRRIFTSAAVLA